MSAAERLQACAVVAVTFLVCCSLCIQTHGGSNAVAPGKKK